MIVVPVDNSPGLAWLSRAQDTRLIAAIWKEREKKTGNKTGLLLPSGKNQIY